MTTTPLLPFSGGGKFTFSNLGSHQIRCKKRDAVDGGDRKTLTFESWQRRRGSIQVFVEAFSRNTVVRNTKYEVGCTGEGARRSNSIKGPTEVKIDDTDFSLPPSLPSFYGGAIDYRPIRTPASARELDLIPPTIAALLSIQHFSPPLLFRSIHLSEHSAKSNR